MRKMGSVPIKRFDPARWLDVKTSSAKRVAMPFGAGPREHLALTMAPVGLRMTLLQAGTK